jgi:TetR/AcrR family transcriptional regulator, transcriptional repressor for nem operon
MGHSKASKANTHARLVATAAARFKERGIDGISLADLMKDLKLTHGGFYKHFASRDELVNEALELALAQSGQVLRERLDEGDATDLSGFADLYLNDAHRNDRAGGCAVAALAADASRKNTDVQARFRAHIDSNIEVLSNAIAGGSAAEARAKALLILSTLYGAMLMARAVGESPLSREILQTARKRIPQLGKAVKRRRPAAAAKKG